MPVETSEGLAQRADPSDVDLLVEAGAGFTVLGADVGTVVAQLRDERDSAVKDCEALAAANAQLERERDEARASVDGLLDAIGYVHQVVDDERVPYPEAQDDPFDFARRLAAERDAATAALAKAKAALKPFAEADDLEDAQDRWNIWEHPAAMNITIGHLRAARAALTPAPEAVSMSRDEQRTLHAALRRSATIIAPEAPKDGE